MTIKRKKEVVSKQKTTQKKLWRQSVMTDEILSKLRDAFLNSATDEQACLYAGISEVTLYRYIDKNPEFWKEKERLKKMPEFSAKKVLVNAIHNWDEKTSQWWLERKAKAEFSTKTEVWLTDKEGNDRSLTALDTLNALLWWDIQ